MGRGGLWGFFAISNKSQQKERAKIAKILAIPVILGYFGHVEGYLLARR
jgi:hypothetical protein